MPKKSKKTKLSKMAQYHENEAIRIQAEIDHLGPGFSEDGPVKTILRKRVFQEKVTAESLHAINRLTQFSKKALIFLLTFQNWFYHEWK